MLNLQASASPNTHATTTSSGPSSSSDNSSYLFFTTRITMPPGTTTAWDLEHAAARSHVRPRESAYIRDAGYGRPGEGYIGEVYEMDHVPGDGPRHHPHRPSDGMHDDDGTLRPSDVEIEDRYGKPIVEDWRMV